MRIVIKSNSLVSMERVSHKTVSMVAKSRQFNLVNMIFVKHTASLWRNARSADAKSNQTWRTLTARTPARPSAGLRWFLIDACWRAQVRTISTHLRCVAVATVQSGYELRDWVENKYILLKFYGNHSDVLYLRRHAGEGRIWSQIRRTTLWQS